MADSREPIDWRGFLAGVAFGRVFGRLFLFIAAGYLGIAAFILVMAWEMGPQRVLDAQRAMPFTKRQDARIVESWVAMEFDPAMLGGVRNWPGFTRVSPCVIVEWQGDWGNARRAFCGTREHLHSEFRLHDLREISPGVPFDFARDANGFRIPEVRLSQAALDYLASQPAMDPFRKYSALEEFRRRMDRPDDNAVQSWTTKPPVFPLVFNPLEPGQAMPAGFVAARLSAQPEWLPFVLLSFFGLAFWYAGMNLVLIRMPLASRIVVGAIPLLGLPWFARELPNALRHASVEVASTFGDTMEDIETTSRISATDPANASMQDGARLTFAIEKGLYADTFGTLHFVPPTAPFPEGNAAFAALTRSATEQVRRLAPPERAELFERLRRDKKSRLLHAGHLFVPVAKEAMNDTRADARQRLAARQFLSEWVVQPVLEPDPREPAFAEKVRIYREMLDIPDTATATMASWVVERASAKPR